MTSPDDQENRPLQVQSSTPNRDKYPSLGRVHSTVLYDGPLSKKEIVYNDIHHHETGELKKRSICFKTTKKSNGVWQKEPSKTFLLDTKEQIEGALQFMKSVCGDGLSDEDGRYFLVPAKGGVDVRKLQQTVGKLSTENKTDLLVQLLNHASQTPDLLAYLMRQADKNPELFSEAAATLNLARYQRALAELNGLISNWNNEGEFQKILTKHPWMFGSEYSERLSTRDLTVSSHLDFVLRRTSDNYIEVIEIKTPLHKPLFRYDSSRHSHFAGQDLSEAVGQAQKYIEELDAGRYMIQSRNGEDTNKIRAKVIIGRNVDNAQLNALRRFNGHLHRIEVITFDQFAQIAGQVVSYLEQLVPNYRVQRGQIETGPYDLDDDIPF